MCGCQHREWWVSVDENVGCGDMKNGAETWVGWCDMAGFILCVPPSPMKVAVQKLFRYLYTLGRRDEAGSWVRLNYFSVIPSVVDGRQWYCQIMQMSINDLYDNRGTLSFTRTYHRGLQQLFFIEDEDSKERDGERGSQERLMGSGYNSGEIWYGLPVICFTWRTVRRQGRRWEIGGKKGKEIS